MSIQRVVLIAAAVAAAGLAAVFPRGGHAASSGPVAAYAFDESSGSVAHDLSGNGNNGAIEHASWTSGRYRGALRFNGTSSDVVVPESSSLDLTNAMTLEAWVRPSSLSSWRAIIVKEQPGELVYALYANSQSGLPAGISYLGGEKTAYGASRLPLSTWTYLAATYDGATLTLYANGKPIRTIQTSGAMPVSGGALRIGGDSVWGEWFDGRIDNVRLYNRALTATEIAGDMTAPVTATSAGDTSAPSAPSGLQRTGATATSVSLAWTASTDNVGVASYGVYANSASVGSTTSTAYTVGGLSCGTSYTFAVDAADAAGNRSAKTSVTASTAACSDTQAPTAPTNLRASTTGTSVSLSWTASADNVGVAGYGVYQGGSLLGSTASASFSVTGLSCGTSYSFSVDAFDAAGNRSAKATISTATAACSDTQAPTAPAGLVVVSVSGSSVSLSWNASTDNVGVAGYDLYNGAATAGATTSTSYTVSGLACGTSYSLLVDAYDAAGNRSAKTGVSATTSACSGGGTGGQANIFLSSSGSNCHRYASPVSYQTAGAANACGPSQLASACALAQAGDTIIVEDGTYSGTTLDGCTGKSGTVTFTTEPGHGCSYSAATPFASLPAANTDTSCPVTFTSELSLRGSSSGATVQNLAFNGIYFDDIYIKYANHITLDHTQSKYFFVRSSDSIAITNGDYGNQFDGTCPTIGAAGSGLPASTNITIAGNIFHDLRRDISPTTHPDGLFIQESDGVTISDNVIYRADVIPLYVNAIFGGTINNIAITGNVIHTSTDHTSGSIGPATPTGNTNTLSLGNNALTNATVAFNTVSGAIRRQETPGPTTNLRVYGNLADQFIEESSPGCTPNGDYAYNIWYDQNARTCDPTDTITNTDPFTSDDVMPNETTLGDLRLTTTTPAIAYVPNSWCTTTGICPTQDLTGATRPNPNHPTARNAGAYENR